MRKGTSALVVATAALLALPAHVAAQARDDAWKKAPHVVVVTPAVSPSSPGPQAPIISLSVKDADLVEVVRSLARIAGINVIFQPGVSGKVTAELVEVRWDHALSVILKTQGLGMEIDGRILSVGQPSRLLPSAP